MTTTSEVIPLQIFRKDIIKGKIEPERKVLESQRAGTGIEAPGQLRLSRKEM